MINAAGELDCMAGYFVEYLGDGSAQVVMNLRFDYMQSERDAAFTGKYGDTPLICIVKVSPGRNDVLIKYISENPNPLRRSDRIWTDAIYPSAGYNTLAGEWLYPVKYAVQHCATAAPVCRPSTRAMKTITNWRT